MNARNAFRHAVTVREKALANSERAFAACRAAYAADDAAVIAEAAAERDRAELALDNAQDAFEATMLALGHSEVPDELVRVLGGRTFDPETGDLR